MIASTHDLPPRWNYFAEESYVSQNLERGTIHNRGGARMLVLSDDFLVATFNVIQRELGPEASALIHSMGCEWGRRAAEQFAAEIAAYRGRPLVQLPLAMFAADLTQAFHHHGWGGFQFDFSRYAEGYITVEVTDPIIGGIVKPSHESVDGLLAAFLAGMFSFFSGADLSAVQTDCCARGALRSRFLLSARPRVGSIMASAGTRTHAEVVAELLTT